MKAYEFFLQAMNQSPTINIEISAHVLSRSINNKQSSALLYELIRLLFWDVDISLHHITPPPIPISECKPAASVFKPCTSAVRTPSAATPPSPFPPSSLSPSSPVSRSPPSSFVLILEVTIIRPSICPPNQHPILPLSRHHLIKEKDQAEIITRAPSSSPNASHTPPATHSPPLNPPSPAPTAQPSYPDIEPLFPTPQSRLQRPAARTRRTPWQLAALTTDACLGSKDVGYAPTSPRREEARWYRKGWKRGRRWWSLG